MHVLKTSDFSSSEFEADLSALQPRLRYFVLSLTGSVHDAEEVIQNTNRVVLEKAGEFIPGSNLRAWVFAIAKIQAKAFHRRLSEKRGFEIADDSLLETISLEESEPDQFEKEREALLECLKQLRPAHRDLIASRYANGRKVSELAVEHEVQPNALAQKLFRIRTRLADCIQTRIKTS